MPACRVVFYREADGSVPVLDWLRRAELRDQGVAAKCYERFARLAESGHELRRPIADYLRDGIHELRVRKGTVNYRVLYFLHGTQVVVLATGLSKEAAVPARDIDRAIERRRRFAADPRLHTYDPGE